MPLMSEVLTRWERERPDAVAITTASATLAGRDRGPARTWSELGVRVRRVAAALRATGIGPGDRVAVLDLNDPSCLEITLACAWIGAANAVVNFRLAPPEMVYVLTDARARMLFAGPGFTGAVEQIREKLPDLREVVALPDGYEAWLNAHEPLEEPHAAAEDDCFLQLYTSGTTGFPRGAMLTHRGMVAHSAATSAIAGMDVDAVVQVAMPLFHVGGTSFALAALFRGARTEIVRVPDPVAVLDHLEHGGVTHTFLVPALLAAMTQVPGAGDRRFPALRQLLYGASPMPLPVMRACLRLFPGTLHQVYGMTEASGVVTALGPADHEDPSVAHRLVSAGTPIDGVEIEVRDPTTREAVPVGEPGEIWVRTAQLMGGYWQRPDATAATITEDGWLRSGDGGHLDADGYLYVTDRIKDMIISGGENVYPAEVERVLAEHPSVGDCAVIGVPDERWGEVPRAVVVAAPGQEIDAAALVAYCREHLAPFKCPAAVDVAAELPRNPTGKVLKRELRAPYWEGHDRRTV